MSLLSALPAGILIGFLLGGRLGNLERLALRWWAVVVSALVIQLFLFTSVVSLPGDVIPILYVLSDGLACAWLIRNIRVAGVPCMALGSSINLAAILVNGGRMPVDGALLARSRGAAFVQALVRGQTPSNSVIADAHTRLVWLTDRFLLPRPFPFPVVFSVGDVLIGIGAAWLIAAGMCRKAAEAAPPEASAA